MKSIGFLLIALISAAIVRIEGGQLKSVCILIPAYNLEDYAEGENEEEEITGWGPGPAGKTHGYAHQGLPIVTHTQGEGEAGPPPSENGNIASGGGGEPRGSLRDPSKPPGPNPGWGYWEWDSESKMWEMEDYRRRKRQTIGSVLAGKLQCGPGTVIHVDKVTLGFSIDNRCLPVRSVCQMTSPAGPQVAHCEGKTGSCDVTVSQQFMQQPCGRRSNYARILYECIPEAERHDICEAKSFQSTGSLVLTSPSFSGSPGAAQSQYLSCECEVNRGNNEALAVPWLRTRLDTGKGGACGEELLLLDTWDDSANRFQLQEELCGVTSKGAKVMTSSVVKVTYIPSPAGKANTGFLLRVQGKPDPKAALAVTCSMVPADGSPGPDAGPPPLPPAPGSSSSSSSPGSDRPPPKLPVNFDLRKYPGLLNKTLSAWRTRLNQQQQQQGSAAGQLGYDTGARAAASPGAVVQQGSDTPHEQFDVTGTNGTLSAVVASLSSIIVVMGSLGVYLWYRRSQKKKQKNAVYFDSRSTVRSNATLYSEPTYQDPAAPGSGVPTTLPVEVVPEPHNAERPNPKTMTDSLQQKGSKPSSDGQPPALPTRPPRPKKDKVRRLPSEEEVTYDNNAGCDVKVVLDADYASLDEISEALCSQDGEIDTDA